MLSRPSVGIYCNLIELRYASAKTQAFFNPFTTDRVKIAKGGGIAPYTHANKINLCKLYHNSMERKELAKEIYLDWWYQLVVFPTGAGRDSLIKVRKYNK